LTAAALDRRFDRELAATRLVLTRFAHRDVNRDQVAFVRAICLAQANAASLYVAGVLGPRGDAYRPDRSFSPAAAHEFHAWQADALADAGADLLVALTLPGAAEAQGLARAMAATGLSYLLSFVVRAEGTLLGGCCGTGTEHIAAIARRFEENA